MTAEEVRAMLQAKVDAVGTVKAWAEANKVSPTFVWDVLKGYKQPSGAVLKPLGLRRAVSYEIAKKPAVAAADPTSGNDVGAGASLPAPAPRGQAHAQD